ncbi:hypothetical protein ACFQU7_09565 [Pseudoroseomonas wenyumeiae]
MSEPAIRVLSPTDAAEFRRIRLEALLRHPEAFGASHAEMVQRDEACFAAMLADNTIFGAELDGRLVGTAAFSRQQGRRRGTRPSCGPSMSRKTNAGSTWESAWYRR